jgi:hypothetical protein
MIFRAVFFLDFAFLTSLRALLVVARFSFSGCGLRTYPQPARHLEAETAGRKLAGKLPDTSLDHTCQN